MPASFFFIDTERVWRGGQDQLFTLMRGLVQRGNRVHLVCFPGTLLETRAHELDIGLDTLAIRWEFDPFSLLRLTTLMRRFRPDIVAFNTPRAILLGNLASRLTGARARIVFRRVNFPLRKNPITRLKYNWGIHRIVAISESIRRQLESSGIPSTRIQTIYEGMDLSRYPERNFRDPRRLGEPVVVGTVTHLSEEKGLKYLVEAAAAIPDVQSRYRFVIVGDGDCRSALELRVRELGLERCFLFAGFQNRPNEYLRTFDVFVLPSLSEGLSSAILYAMANSLPVIASNIGGIPELVRSGETGLLIPPADPDVLAAALQQLADDPQQAFQMGQHGRRRIAEEFTLERKILETEELCLSLLKQSAPLSPAHA
jgi:glycosyltransferase involved in cell wall biosynthesis